jgi:hypothetical protein
MDELRADSWLHLQELLFAESWHEELGRHRSDFAFRGRNDADEGLQTSLARLGGDARTLEGHLLRNFRRYAQREDVPFDSVWNWLALGQHHGLPTRLLDWTYSPYVALHFATSELTRFDCDGVVWRLNFPRAHEEAPEPLRDALNREGMNTYTAEVLETAAGGLGAVERLADDDFVVFLEPPALSDRIVNQYALFSLMSRPDASLGDWLAERPELVQRIVVPAELKWEARDKLDQANVTERVLFPGLDGLSRWLMRYYLPRRSRSRT